MFVRLEPTPKCFKNYDGVVPEIHIHHKFK